MAPIQSIPPAKPPLVWPPRPSHPARRCASSRAATLCFWTVFLLFVAAVGYLGALAYSAEGGSLILSSGADGRLLAGALLAGSAIAAVCIAARHHTHHHHHPRH
jgi:hypothetical protein